MAAVPAPREAAGRSGLDGESLSGFERRCLLKHICECHELIRLTILGAGTAREKAGAAVDLARIYEAKGDLTNAAGQYSVALDNQP